MKKLVVATVLSASVIVGMGSSVFAGEITGSGKGGPNHDGTPGGIGRAASACVYSGLDDGAGVPGTVQNWGHVADDPVFVEIVASKGASEVTVWVDFGGGPFLVTIGCNPHAGGE